MKKIIILILLAFPSVLSAQDIRFGVKGGLNLANYKGEDNGGHFKAGAYAGLFANYRFTDIISLQTELVYSQEGSRDHVNGNSVTTSLDYLILPVLLQLRLNNYEQFKFVLGPQIGYLLDSKVKTKTDSGTDTTHDQSVFEDYDYGVIMGLEYEFSDELLITIRYYLGLSDFFNQNKVESSAKNSVISMGAAYQF